MTVESDLIAKYISVAKDNMRDALTGKYEIETGSSIILDQAGNARLDTAGNREAFIANGYSFWKNVSPDLEKELAVYANAARQFGASLDVNIKGNLNGIVPGINLPSWVNFIPSIVNIRFNEYKELSVNRNDFCEHLIEKRVVPGRNVLKENGLEKVLAGNFCRAYELSHDTIVFRFIAFFVTPVAEDPVTHDMKIVPADNAVYQALMSFFKKWENESGIQKPNCNCFILATPQEWADMTPTTLHDNVQLLCHLNEKSQWIVRHLPLNNYSKMYRHFIYSLYPETLDERCEKFKDFIMNYRRNGGTGNITVKKLANAFNIPSEMVEICCDKLQETKQFVNYISGEDKAIRERDTEDSGKLIRFNEVESRSFKIVKGVLVAFIGACFTQIRGVINSFMNTNTQNSSIKAGIFGFAVLVISFYIINCIQGLFERKLNK